MVSITAEGKTYELKHRMTNKQMRDSRTFGNKFVDLEERLKTDGEEAILKELMTTTIEEQDFILSTVKSCLGQSQEENDSMEFMHTVAVYSALFQVSTPHPNSSSPSEKPTIGTTSLESPTAPKL